MCGGSAAGHDGHGCLPPQGQSPAGGRENNGDVAGEGAGEGLRPDAGGEAEVLLLSGQAGGGGWEAGLGGGGDGLVGRAGGAGE